MPDAMQDKRRLLLRIAEAAEALAVSPAFIRTLIQRGDLEAFRINKGVSHVSAASIRRWLKDRRTAETRQPEPISL